MTVSVENLKVISNYSKVQGYKLNKQKSSLLYIPTMIVSFDIKNTIPSSYMSTPKMKYLGINLINYV